MSMGEMKALDLFKKLAADRDLEFFYKENNGFRFYCYGGKFLDITKAGSLKKHEYDEYFSSEEAESRNAFMCASKQADLMRVYMPGGDIYESSKTALKNRSANKRPFAEKVNTRGLDPAERLYQQTISRNNRPKADRTSGVADFSFGVPSRYINGDTLEKPSISIVDMIWVDECEKQIAFVEYKQGDKALHGKSGLQAHCAKTFLCMENREVKASALTRYFVKKALCSGDFSTPVSALEMHAKSVADEFKSVCVFMFTNAAESRIVTALNSLKGNEKQINDHIRELNPKSTVEVNWNKAKYIYFENFDTVKLSQGSLRKFS